MSSEKDYRRLLQDLAIKSQEQYDKTILTLSTGALSISFAFIKDLVNIDKAVETEYLIYGWIAFIMSMVCTLISFLSSKHALEKAIIFLDDKRSGKNFWDELTTYCNWVSFLAFVIGLFLIIYFVKTNIGE